MSIFCAILITVERVKWSTIKLGHQKINSYKMNRTFMKGSSWDPFSLGVCSDCLNEKTT